MIKTKRRSILAVLLVAISMTITFSPALAAPGQNEQASLPVAKAGPLEITPTRVKLVLTKEGEYTCFKPVLRLKIKNTAAAEVRVILFNNSFQIIDELDTTWLNRNPDLISGGIGLSYQRSDAFAEAFTKEKDQFATVPPQQTVEAQIMLDPAHDRGSGYRRCVQDKGNEMLQTHRPKTIALSASIGITDLDNKIQIVPFSFSDLPVTEISVK